MHGVSVAPAELDDERTVVVIGKEGAGKSQLIQSIAGQRTYSANFRGTTLSCESYRQGRFIFVDTPGILIGSDSVTTRLALTRLRATEAVLLVVRGTHIDADLADLLPLACAKRGVVVVTFWDKVQARPAAARALEALSSALGLTLVAVDGRHLTEADRAHINGALEHPDPIRDGATPIHVGWQIEPAVSALEHRWLGPPLAFALLLIPAVSAITCANTFAAWIEPAVKASIDRVIPLLSGAPAPLAAVLHGKYGLLTMGPLLFVWSVPTVALFAFFLGAYKASGLVDRITTAIHPQMCWFGLTGRDVTRVVMGFGCNVPAVISTRACASGTRGTCLSTIAFGSACSYQFGATLAVFAAAGRPGLIVPFLGVLLVSTLIYTKLTAPGGRRMSLVLLREGRAFLEWPRADRVWQEARGTLAQFFQLAIPLFLVISAIASLLDWLGATAAIAAAIGPGMTLFNLPAEAAVPVVLASIRKDGILLFAEPHLAGRMTDGQLLTGVYLAGVLLPCVVTAFTIATEQSPRFVFKLLIKQASAALLFSLLLSWICAGLGV